MKNPDLIKLPFKSKYTVEDFELACENEADEWLDELYFDTFYWEVHGGQD